jgi:phosphate acyltransferase
VNSSDYSSHKYVIAVDVMGGDEDPYAAIFGVRQLVTTHSNIHCILFGDEEKIRVIIDEIPDILPYITIEHCVEVILSGDKPTVALRNSKGTSMRQALEAVQEKRAHAIVSSGNTGALMVIGRSVLKTLPGINRPAIAACVPTTSSNPVTLIDAGANAECNDESFVDFAIMGEAFAKAMFNLDKPRVGILNIGIEDIKGTEFIKKAMQNLRDNEHNFNFIGYVEGNNLSDGTVDVVVTDGFTGNVALKTIEGTAKLCQYYLKKTFNHSWLAKIGYLLLSRSLKHTFKKIDKRTYNGAMFVGLNGIVVKSHGSSDETAFYYALKSAVNLIQHDINVKIVAELKNSTSKENLISKLCKKIIN